MAAAYWTSSLALSICGSDCCDIRIDGFFPRSECEEDVRSHVLGVARIWRNLRIQTCCTQTERRVRRIIVAMNQVMKQPGVFVIINPCFFEHTSGAHVRRFVATLVSCTKNRETVESYCVDVLR